MALAAPVPSKPAPSLWQRALGLVRSGCVLGVIIGATATNVSLAVAIHTVSFNRRKAQGR